MRTNRALIATATAVLLLAGRAAAADPKPAEGAQPSAADRQLTRKLKRILEDLDIVVHDHIIIAGPDRYYSFAEHGELD